MDFKLADRFIPTHVGNANQTITQSYLGPVHPHACGERGVEVKGNFQMFGSSPRMWGTLQELTDYHVVIRFIPTHVGNACAVVAASIVLSVHPHACGERLLEVRITERCGGSSPRMWGTLCRWRREGCQNRFIPTHVGNAALIARKPLLFPVHPHACGERCSFLVLHKPDLGSSPRMWGTRHLLRSAGRPGRFIPTHVGNASRGAPGPRR